MSDKAALDVNVDPIIDPVEAATDPANDPKPLPIITATVTDAEIASAVAYAKRTDNTKFMSYFGEGPLSLALKLILERLDALDRRITNLGG